MGEALDGLEMTEHERQVVVDTFMRCEQHDDIAYDLCDWLLQAKTAYLESRRDHEAISALVPALARLFDVDFRETVTFTRDVARNEPDGDGWAIEALPLVERVAAWAFAATHGEGTVQTNGES